VAQDDPRARATRGLRRPSLDARSWDHPGHPLLGDSSLRPCLRNGAPGLGGWEPWTFWASCLGFISYSRSTVHRRSAGL